MKKKYLDLLGVGSIGQQVINIVLANPNHFEIHAISLSSNDKINEEILSKIEPKIACVRTQEQFQKYQIKYPNIMWLYGDEGLLTIAKNNKSDLFINALFGSVGLLPTIYAIETKKDILLANKETLVMAGEIIIPLAKKHNISLMPIDSEHNALYQLLQGEDIKTVKEIIITASGGSLRDLSYEDLDDVTVDQALNHPNWKMGPKITIDSATMMNKVFEIIEAHHLFNLPYDQIKTVLHKESYVHAMIHFIDGHTKLLMSKPNMELSILNALYNQKRIPFLEPLIPNQLNFKEMDYQRYPLVEIGYKIAKQGGLMPTVMQAANEAAVKLFLNNKIKFNDINKIIINAINKFSNQKNPSLETIIKTNDDIIKAILNEYERG